jgi:hypothetical protein
MLLVDLAEVKTLPQALTAFQRVGMAAKNFSPRTRTEYTHDLTELIAFLAKHGITTLETVTSPHLEAYQAELDRRGLAVSSRRRKTFVIKTFFFRGIRGLEKGASLVGVVFAFIFIPWARRRCGRVKLTACCGNVLGSAVSKKGQTGKRS